MNHWPFISAAYLLTALGTLGVALWSFAAMRSAERRADEIGRDR